MFREQNVPSVSVEILNQRGREAWDGLMANPDDPGINIDGHNLQDFLNASRRHRLSYLEYVQKKVIQYAKVVDIFNREGIKHSILKYGYPAFYHSFGEITSERLVELVKLIGKVRERSREVHGDPKDKKIKVDYVFVDYDDIYCSVVRPLKRNRKSSVENGQVCKIKKKTVYELVCELPQRKEGA